MWNWIKSLWSKAIKAFKEFIAIAIPIATQIVIGALKDYAIDVVSKLEVSDITNEQKRKEALKMLVGEAKSRGIQLSTSLANTIIELAVQYIKAKVR